MRIIRKFAERNVFWPCARRGILVSNDVEYGFARMFEMLRENAGEKGIRVFGILDDAVAWIFLTEANTCRLLIKQFPRCPATSEPGRESHFGTALQRRA